MTLRSSSVTLLLVRHGESTWNAARRLQGQTAHVPLTHRGRAQAVAAARALVALRPGALVSSDLLRARQTAELCARHTGLPLSTTAALREQAYGVLEGTSCDQAAATAQWRDPEWAAEGGESVVQLHDRVRDYLEQLCADPPADVVALVTHGDTIRAAQAVAAGRGPAGMPRATPGNGSVTELTMKPRDSC